MSEISNVSALFRARLHIGYIAFPYAILGFFLHWSLYGFNLELMSKDPGSFYRIIVSVVISFIYMPYLFVINDYFDAPYDALDEEKKIRNPFCNKDFREKANVKILMILPGLITLILGFLISVEAGIITIFALFFGIFYSAPPLRFKERTIADFTVHGLSLGVYFFSLGFYSIYITANPYVLPVFWLAMYLAFIDGAWIHFDSSFVDYYTDKKGDQKTTVVSIGPEKSLIILSLMLLSILVLPSIYFFTNSQFNEKFGLIGLFFSISFLILPISYIVIAFINRGHFERIRTISSRYRVYVVYSMTFFVVLLSNKSIYS